MESNAIAALVTPAMPQNGGALAETPVATGGEKMSSLFSRMLNLTTEASLPVAIPDAQTLAQSVAVAVPMTELLLPGGTTSQPSPTTGNQASNGMDTITKLVFQAPLPENGGTLQNVGKGDNAGTVPMPVRNETAVVTAPAANGTADRDQYPTGEPSRETSELLLAAALQLLSQPVATAGQLQKRADAPASAETSVTPLQTVKTGDTATTAVTPATVAVANAQGTVPAGATTEPPVATSATPQQTGPRTMAAPIAADVARNQAAAVSQVAPEGTDREPLFGAVRAELVAQSGGKPARLPVRGGHEQESVRGAETPAPIANGRMFNRPLLEVVVEETADSFEPAPKTVKADLLSDTATVAKSQQTLIGGAGAMKGEPAALPAEAGTVKPAGHEQILAQVKEQLGKAEFRADDGRVVLRLHPEELGSLRIDVKLDDQRLRLHIVAENPAVREALAANMDSLKETLSRQQIVMEHVDVSTGQGHEHQQLFREHRQHVQDGQAHRPGRFVSERAEDGDVVDHRAMTAYWAPQEGSLLDVRF